MERWARLATVLSISSGLAAAARGQTPATPDAAARAAWLFALLGATVVANSASNLGHRRQALV